MKTRMWQPVVLYLLYCWMSGSSGSEIKFINSTSTIIPLLTPSLTLRCSLSDTGSPSGSVVGRDVSYTTDDIPHLTSVVISRGKDALASVFLFHPPRPFQDHDNIQVTGHVSGMPPERAFLEVTWLHPSREQVGDYKCDIYGVTDEGHIVGISDTLSIDSATPSFSDTFSIDSATPSVDDLVQHIHALKLDNKALRENMEVEITNLKTEVQRLGHVESGIVECRRGDAPVYMATKTQSFQTSYDQAPIIHISVHDTNYGLRDSSKIVYYTVNVVSVDKDKFTIRCDFVPSYMSFINMNVNWLSIPS